MQRYPVLIVTRNSLLVTRDKPPFAEASGDKPPRASPTPPLDEELIQRRYEPSSPPLEGCPNTRAPRDVSRGWLGRGGKRARNVAISPLTCHSRLIHPTNIFMFAGTPGAGMTKKVWA